MFSQRRQQFPSLKQIWEQFQHLPPPQTEESIPLRILVQLLVAVGIIATDLAAGTAFSFWTIPVSVIGAIWSWQRRHYRNIAVKFLIAIGMLIALAVFFRNLLGSLNDTRLVLAELLIQLQVLHSFDLPRRKDLGYSMVIGLILLGVAGTLSQTLAFAPLLIVFLIIGLPVLVLDYRSRLGLALSSLPETKSASGQKFFSSSTFSIRRLTIFFLLILSLGLLIFALMPRLPSYQIQTFPVSGPENLENEGFDNKERQIQNSGYVQEGQGEGGGSGNVETPVEGPGEVDEQFYYGFSNQINQNLRGELKPKVVLRLRSQSNGWVKVLGFDQYTGQGWKIEKEKPTVDVKRPPWSYRFRLNTQPTQAETEEIVQTYTVVSDLPNLIPTIPQAEDIYFPTREIAVDPHGGIQSPVELVEGLTYTVVSEVPYRDRAQLRQAGTNYPDTITETYLQIPPEIEEKVRQQAQTLLAESPKPLNSTYEKVLYLAQAVKQNYRLRPNIPYLAEDEDLVTTFLFDWEGGYPDHFSTTLTIMLRSLDIPARLATGFDTGRFNPFTGLYLIRNTDAFALTEVYFPNYGWFQFDPIPGHDLIPPSIEQSQTFSVLRQFWNWIAGWLPSPVTSWFNYVWNVVIGGLVGFVTSLWRFFSQGWGGLLAGLMSLVVVSFLGWLSWQQLQRWRYQRWLSRLPAMERLYQQMLRVLAQQATAKDPAQTPFEYVKTVNQTLEQSQSEVVQEISEAYVSWRYGNYAANLEYLQDSLK
ncbi:MAG: transglutaminaseTgpA domain-containing protein, partial [Halothece sp.]